MSNFVASPMPKAKVTERFLTGQLLIAMPSMSDPRFERSVIYMCAHTEAGALGLVVNRLAERMQFAELIEQLGIPAGPGVNDIMVHLGGPVEQGRGFVLHSADYVRDNTLAVTGDVALTASVDVLAAIADGRGPRRSLLALGYAGWGPGQLESEITDNGWLHAPADEDLLFNASVDHKWHQAIRKIGLDVSMLSSTAGHA